MPRKSSRRKSQRGAGIGQDIMSGLKSVERWARKNKAVSKVGRALDSVGVPYAGKVAKVASQLGYNSQMGLGNAAAIRRAMK